MKGIGEVGRVEANSAEGYRPCSEDQPVLGLSRLQSCQPLQDAINRRFKRVLPRFTIWSILFGLRSALGLGFLSVGSLG